MLLAGDVGGTKTNLAIYSSEKGLRAPLAEKSFHSANYPSLEAVIQEFLSSKQYPIERATFGVAGPVVAGRATITNLPWIMEETQLQHELNILSVRLLNDLVATAHGVFTLNDADIHTLNKGEMHAQETLAVIAPGTGLGEGFMTWNGRRYLVHPSEGGHADFAPSNSLETEMLSHLFAHYPHVSYERICSGKGIPNIYHFLKESMYEEPSWLAHQMAETTDQTALIMNTALSEEVDSPLCKATAEVFVSVLGAEAGNLALKVMATGGVYLGGGIPPRVLPLLNEQRFMDAFKRKGRFTKLMARIPVHVVLNPKIALLGAASYALSILPEEEEAHVMS